jgi:Ca2+:H+ antiporter
VLRRILWASLALTPATLVARYVFHAGDVTLFAFAALSLVPLAWLIGEATEHAGEHTGPTIGGFLNASFGNAPELIIVLFAVADGLPDVVRGSITGSIVSNILLVLGVAMAVGGNARERLDLRSLILQLGLVFVAVLAFLIPSVPSWHGNPERHSVVVLSIPVSIALLALYVFMTVRNLRRGAAAHDEEAGASAWSLQRSLVALGTATIATALVSETLVHSLTGFAEAAGLSQFFISAVIVAIVGNAAEHGGAIVIAHRGNTELATEIAISSSMQVAVFVAPAVALLSWIVGAGLPLSFRIVEVVTMAAAAAFATLVVWDGRSRRWEGFLLVGVYGCVVVAYFLS